VCRTPFVTFATPKSQLWPKLTASLPGLQDGDPVLVRPDPETPVRLVPFRFHVVAAKQFFANTADDGSLVKTYAEKPDGKSDEYIETALLVYTDAGIVAARCTWKNTKCPAAHEACKALNLAASPDWSKQSADHAASMRAPKPFMRFTCISTPQVRSSRATGRRYVTTRGQIVPTTIADVDKLSAYFREESNAQKLRDVADHLTRRMEEVARKRS
jgi:hypothetical protein